jgi:tetratricopeptide (TPR) repeat protein
MAAGLLPVALASLSRPHYGFIIQPHWLSFVSLGFFVGAGQLLAELSRRMKVSLWVAALVCVSNAYILAGWQYNYLWGSEKRYISYWLDQSPGSYLPNFWMGSIQLERGDLATARVHYERILQRKFTDWETYVNLGVIEHYAGNGAKAMDYYHKALAVKADCADALNNIGVIKRDGGEREQALGYFTRALQADGRHKDARRNLDGLR